MTKHKICSGCTPIYKELLKTFSYNAVEEMKKDKIICNCCDEINKT
jgi:hypothetical protein